MFFHHAFHQEKENGQQSGEQNRQLGNVRRFSARFRSHSGKKTVKLQTKRIPEKKEIPCARGKNGRQKQIKQLFLSVPGVPQGSAEKTGKGIYNQAVYMNTVKRMQKQKQAENTRKKKGELRSKTSVFPFLFLFSGPDFNAFHVLYPLSLLFRRFI